MSLPNCWELMKCGREAGGAKAEELGVCVAFTEKLGHSCWALAGTLCGGKVNGTAAKKKMNCMSCEVYKKYNRSLGSLKSEVIQQCKEEQERYSQLICSRFKE